MTREEEKTLLLKVLCALLPYGVKAQYYGSEEEMLIVDTIEAIYTQPSVEIVIGQYGLEIEDIKPYLRPMSSMTEREKSELWWVTYCDDPDITEQSQRHIDWLNAHHFDYRGLIPKGLALPAPEGMYEV